ncbi:hypothetical protein JCM10207_009074 [Rhodosporidiobolus poonsookiae]
MCRARTVLSYSISVTTESLIYAADAHPSLEPTLPFFDLVSLRIRQGRLQSTSSAVKSVPVEVWELIKDELVQVELDVARFAFLEKLLCDDCHLLRHDELKYADWDILISGGCDYCLEGFWNEEGVDDNARKARLEKLLGRYELILPLLTPIRSSKDASDSPFFNACGDPNTAILIGLPASSKPNTTGVYQVEALCGGDWAPDEQAIQTVTPHPPPLNAIDRFKALVKLFKLELVEASDGMLAIEGTPAAVAGKKKVLRKKRFRKVKLEDLKPRWKLFTTCETTW